MMQLFIRESSHHRLHIVAIFTEAILKANDPQCSLCSDVPIGAILGGSRGLCDDVT